MERERWAEGELGAVSVGGRYTDETIGAALGCGRQGTLRHTPDGMVAAACLDLGRHPLAPEELWVRRLAEPDHAAEAAERFVRQCAADPRLAVPLFTRPVWAKKAWGAGWVYQGRYRVRRREAAPAELAARQGLGPLRCVLLLERRGD